MEMVLLDTLEEEDEQLLKTMIENHQRFTGSDLAARILKNWMESFPQFVKVMPTDYKAVLAKKKTEEKKVTVKV